METNPQDQRQRFVRAALSGQWAMSELCVRFEISRPTGYLWLERYRAAGVAGLVDRSHAAHDCPHRVAAPLEAAIVAARRQYGWGARKLRQVLCTRDPGAPWPAISTFNAVLARHGLLRRSVRRPRWTHPGCGPLVTTAPNQVWPADFKGQFKTRDGVYCFPLTITDHYSRAVLACQGLSSVGASDARRVFRTLFRAVGLPDAIRTDNGTPFVTGALGLSALSVWWMQLGIVHQRIRPARPQDNGTHERMHRELKRETTRPPAATRGAQQRRFDAFCQRYNYERPHEALHDATPATHWHPSARAYLERPTPPTYPAALEIRRVSTCGAISWAGRALFVTELLRGEDVACEEVADGIWNIVYYQTLLGRLDLRTGRVTGTV